MEKKISVMELTTSQLMNVLDKNQKLREDCKNDYGDVVLQDIRGMIKCIQPALFDFSIGITRGYSYQSEKPNFMKIKDNKEFLEGVIKMQEKSRFMRLLKTDKERQLINKAKNQCDELYCKEKDDHAETQFDETIKQLKKIVLEAFNRYTTITNGDIMSHFLNGYITKQMSQDDYVTDLENPVVYRNQTIDPNFI